MLPQIFDANTIKISRKNLIQTLKYFVSAILYGALSPPGVEGVVNEKRSGELSCLHLAVQANKLEIVELLISKGALINCLTTAHHVTPLLLACQQNSFEIVTYLLEK